MSGMVESEIELEETAPTFARRSIQRTDDFRKHVRKKQSGQYRSQTSTRSDPGYIAQYSVPDKEHDHVYLPQHSLDSGMSRLAPLSGNISDGSADSSYISAGDSSSSSGETAERGSTHSDTSNDAGDSEAATDFSKYAQSTISELTNMIQNIETNNSAASVQDINHNLKRNDDHDPSNSSDPDDNPLEIDPLDLIGSAASSVGVDVARGVGFVGEAASNAWDFFSSTLDKLTAADQESDISWHDADSDISVEGETFQDAQEDLTPKDRLHYICTELLTTEEAYVARLNIIVKVKEKTKQLFGNELARQMFHDIETIHTFHYNYLLPTLDERLKKWGQYEKIGDVMKKLAPFLKLYTDYVKDFQKSSVLVSSYEEKSSSFAAILKEAQVSQPARCGKHRIQTHMMEPVQRVPRYELLLKDYLKHLPADSADRNDTEEALLSVSQVAQHFEAMMKRDSRISTLLEIQSKLEGAHNIVTPRRELVKEGCLHKVGTRGGLSDRYIYLFNDSLLICSRVNLVVLEKLRVKTEFNLNDVWVIEGTNLEYPNTFCLRSWDSFVELHASSLEEKDKWVSAVRDTKEKLASRTDQTDGQQQDIGVCRCSGQLLVSSDDAKTWNKKHLAINTNGWMYTYRSPNEPKPITGINLHHFSKKMIDAPYPKRGKVILLSAIGKKYYFYSETESTLTRWMAQMDSTSDIISKKKMSASRVRISRK